MPHPKGFYTREYQNTVFRQRLQTLEGLATARESMGSYDYEEKDLPGLEAVIKKQVTNYKSCVISGVCSATSLDELMRIADVVSSLNKDLTYGIAMSDTVDMLDSVMGDGLRNLTKDWKECHDGPKPEEVEPLRKAIEASSKVCPRAVEQLANLTKLL